MYANLCRSSDLFEYEWCTGDWIAHDDDSCHGTSGKHVRAKVLEISKDKLQHQCEEDAGLGNGIDIELSRGEPFVYVSIDPS